MKISENTSVSMPMKNMIGIVIAVAMGVFAYTELTSRLVSLETSRELFENDLLNVKDQFLSYAIHVEDANQNKTITYSNVHFENNGVMQVSSSAYPGPKDSKSVTTFSQTGLGLDVWVSESISAEPGINGNEAVHTAAIYSDTFVGEVSVEVTLDNQVDNDTNWATATTVSINNVKTCPARSFK